MDILAINKNKIWNNKKSRYFRNGFLKKKKAIRTKSIVNIKKKKSENGWYRKWSLKHIPAVFDRIRCTAQKYIYKPL